MKSEFFQICIFFLATAKQYPLIRRTKREKCFVNPANGEVLEFPSLKDECSLDLSVIVPAYNEEARCKCNYLKFRYLWNDI